MVRIAPSVWTHFCNVCAVNNFDGAFQIDAMKSKGAVVERHHDTFVDRVRRLIVSALQHWARSKDQVMQQEETFMMFSQKLCGRCAMMISCRNPMSASAADA